jgi:hypothetical protein
MFVPRGFVWTCGLAAAAAVVLALGAGPADAARQKIAVLGIEPKDEGDAKTRHKNAALAHVLTDELRVRALDAGFDLAPGSQKDLVELKLLSECLDEAPGCMAIIGRQLGADVVVYGHLERPPGKGVTVTLVRVDTATRTAKSLEVPATVAATEEGMRKLAASAMIAPAVEAPPAAEPTKLVVKTNIAATVYVNGLARGTTAEGQPLVVNDLPAGGVQLTVEAPRHRRYESPVDVKAHGRTEVTVALEPSEGAAAAPTTAEPPTPPTAGSKTARVMFWSTLVATGAGVAAFTITGLQVRSIEKEQDQAIAEWGDGFKANGVQFPNDACAEARNDGFSKLVDVCDRGRNMATVTNVLIGVTAAAAVASAIFYWRGYLAPGTHETVGAAHGSTRQMVFSPELYKNGAGLGAAIQF